MVKNPAVRHVVPTAGGWSVKKKGSARPESTHRTQAAAEQHAKERVRREGGGEVRIHGRDGRVRDSDAVAPGRDRHPPKDVVAPKSGWEIRRELRVTKRDLDLARRAIEDK